MFEEPNKPYLDQFKTVRLARVESVNIEKGTAQIYWLDGFGTFDEVLISQPMLGVDTDTKQAYGIFANPQKGTVVLIGMRENQRPVIIAYVPVQFEKYGAFGLTSTTIEQGSIVLRSAAKARLTFTREGEVILNMDDSVDSTSENTTVVKINNLGDINIGQARFVTMDTFNDVILKNGDHVQVDDVDNVLISGNDLVQLSLNGSKIELQPDSTINLEDTANNNKITIDVPNKKLVLTNETQTITIDKTNNKIEIADGTNSIIVDTSNNKILIEGTEVNINNGTKGVARQNDTVRVDLGGVHIESTPHTFPAGSYVYGTITSGSTTVKAGD
jgi:hypothetical protein